MKKILLGLMIALACYVSPAMADRDSNKKVAFGTVSAVSVTERTFNIKGDDGQNYQFIVNPKTEMEVKREYWFDTSAELKDLEPGNWVKVEYYFMNPTHLIADEVDIHR